MRKFSSSLIKQISRQKQEPKWMLELRLKGLKLFYQLALPHWGPDLSQLDFDSITYFNQPEVLRRRNWADVPQKTKAVFEKLGIPQAERRVLAGLGAQWDNNLVYENLKARLSRKGVLFCEMDEAVRKYPRLVKRYFMTQAVKPDNNKFSALHAAVWSGGLFLYVPKGVKVKEPLEGYFWLNLRRGGQFEHSLIIADEGSEVQYIEGCSAPTYSQDSLHVGCVEVFVGRKAKVRFSTIQNWSKNVINLGMKRALVAENGTMEWVSASLGSKLTMVYPSSVLAAAGAKTEHLSLSLATKDQILDTGGQAVHLAKNTSSNIVSKSIAKDGGTATYRGLVKIIKGAKNAKTSVVCQSLILDKKSGAKTYPAMEIAEDEVIALHEAKTGKIAEEELFYLMSRGLSEGEAMSLIINGFIEPVVKNLPLEYAVEINKLIDFYAEC